MQSILQCTKTDCLKIKISKDLISFNHYGFIDGTRPAALRNHSR